VHTLDGRPLVNAGLHDTLANLVDAAIISDR
jgi:hypothetical protein